MPKNSWIIIPAMVLAVGLTALFFLPSREPTYKGKPLSYWLRAYEPPGVKQTPTGFEEIPKVNAPTESEARAAIEAIGTNSLPTLLRMIQHRQNPVKGWIARSMRDVYTKLFKGGSLVAENYEAMMAFKVLGSRAAPAVPQLIEIFDHETERHLRDWVLPTLREIGPSAKEAIPMLVAQAAGTNAWLRENAILALGAIHGDAPHVVPVLVDGLKDPNSRICFAAAFALQSYGAEAKAAVPELLALIDSPQRRAASPNAGMSSFGGVKLQTPTVGSIASNALRNIDPEAALKAGIKPMPW